MQTTTDGRDDSADVVACTLLRLGHSKREGDRQRERQTGTANYQWSPSQRLRSSSNGSDDTTATASSTFATLRVAFVEDEIPNCRLGLRLLTRLGLKSENITLLHDGTVGTVTLLTVATGTVEVA